MAALSIETIRPLSTTAEVVLKLAGSLEPAGDAELRDAVAYALGRVGGPLVVDLTGLTSVAPACAETVGWIADEVRTVERVPHLRNVSAEVEVTLAGAGVRARYEVGGA